MERHEASPADWRVAGDTVAALVETLDWSATPLGPREHWSGALQLAVGIVQTSAFPMALRWGRDFVLIYNDAYRPILGEKHPWAMGRPAREAWAEVWSELEAQHLAILDRTMPSIFAADLALRIQRNGDQWEDARFTVSYSPVHDPTAPSGVGGVLVTAVEITERVAIETALRTSEERYELALGAAGAIGTWDWDIVHDRVVANTKFAEIYSVDPARAAQGAPIAEFVGGIHPDDRDRVEQEINASIQFHTDFTSEYRLSQKDGSIIWVYARGRCHYDDEGAPVRLPGATVDITDRKLAEDALVENRRHLQALNATLETRVAEQSAERDRLWQTSQDLLVVVGEDGVFKAANPAWTSVLGWSPQEVIGRTHLDFIVPEDHAASEDAHRLAVNDPLPVFVNRYLHKDGGFRWISWIASPEHGLIYAAGRNITAEKTAAIELAAAQEALRQSQKMDAVGQLTGGIAHDFNNMLAVVIGSLDLLSRRISGDDARAGRYLDAATDGARRAALLTQRLLAFSRQQPLQPEAVDANKLVAGMSDLLRHSIGADVRLETVLAGGLWRTHADPNQLENVVLNLALNARDAMPGGGRLTIETQNAHLDDRYAAAHVGLTPGQYVMIAVTDTGAGMPADVMEKAFDPFFTTKPIGKGTGLGLSQVYGFVKQSGGHVKIYSEPGVGATIKIYLPRLRDATATRDDVGAATPLALGDIREVILVVEDEPAVRQFSLDALEELGYLALEADGAEAALKLIDAHPEIVLLFTDVVMPDVNGAKLAEEVRRRRPDIKVLFTTGYTRNAIVHNGVLDAGVEMIGKPFTVEALAAKVRAVLERSAPEA